MRFSCFSVLPGSEEAQAIWGGIAICLLIAYFISNNSAKKYQNPFLCLKVIATQSWDVFLRHGVEFIYLFIIKIVHKVHKKLHTTIQ